MFLHEMTAVSAWIVHTRVSRAVQGLHGYVAMNQSVHILAISALSASTAMLNLRLLGLMNRSQSIAELCARFRRPVWIAVLVLLASGLALLLAEPKRSLTSQVFQLKMLMLVVVIALTVLLQRAALRYAPEWDAAGRAPMAARVPRCCPWCCGCASSSPDAGSLMRSTEVCRQEFP